LRRSGSDNDSDSGLSVTGDISKYTWRERSI